MIRTRATRMQVFVFSMVIGTVIGLAPVVRADSPSPLDQLNTITKQEIGRLQREQDDVAHVIIQKTLVPKPDRSALVQAVTRLIRIDARLPVLYYEQKAENLTEHDFQENLLLYDIGDCATFDEVVNHSVGAVVSHVFHLDRVFQFKRLQARSIRIRRREHPLKGVVEKVAPKTIAASGK